MGSRPEEKAYKIFQIPIPNAVSDKGAMVIVNLHTDAALAAVKRSWRPEVVAGFTVAKFIMFFLLVNDPVLVIIQVHPKINVLVERVELLGGVLNTLVLHCVAKVSLGLILDVIVLI